MIKYTSEHQLSIEEFKTPFQAKLLADNRWVQLSKIVPWDKFASAYMSMMTADFGRLSGYLPTHCIRGVNHQTFGEA